MRLLSRHFSRISVFPKLQLGLEYSASKSSPRIFINYHSWVGKLWAQYIIACTINGSSITSDTMLHTGPLSCCFYWCLAEESKIPWASGSRMTQLFEKDLILTRSRCSLYHLLTYLKGRPKAAPATQNTSPKCSGGGQKRGS